MTRLLRKLVYGLALLSLSVPLVAADPGVTAADIAVVKKKLNMAVPYFDRTWAHIFAIRGLHFAPPQVVTYTTSVNTGCGELKSGNAYFCSTDNHVYLDLELLASQMKKTAQFTHTDGDYAAIVVAAHEMGHAVHQQLATAKMASFNEEQTADCFAGAVTNEARADGYLERGDLAEGRYSLTIAGDFAPVGGIFGRLYDQVQPGAHGTSSDRVLAFNRGYYAGPAACVEQLGAAGLSPAGRMLFHEGFHPPANAQPKFTSSCSYRPAIGGVLVEDVDPERNGSCNLRLIDFGTIPNNVRIEATFRIERGNPDAMVGVFFGVPLKGAFDQYYVGYAQAGGGAGLEAKPLGRLAGSPPFGPAVAAKGLGALNRVTVDIHREADDATLLLYVNGKFVDMAMPLFGSAKVSTTKDEQGGVYIGSPGVQVLFSDFRVLDLPPDP